MNPPGITNAPPASETEPGKPQGTLDWAKDVRFSSWNDRISEEREFRPLPWGKISILLLALAALMLPFLIRDDAGMRMFALVFVSIILEALPFMLIGSLVGGLIEVFVSREKFTSRLPRRPWAAVCMAAAIGLVFPVCECAIVPVVRRLVRKGLPLSAAVAYLLGGPIVNPIVGASTLLAYKFNWIVPAIRLTAGYAIAVIVGLVMGRFFSRRTAFLETHESHEAISKLHEKMDATKRVPPQPHAHSCACGHAHAQGAHEAHGKLPGRIFAAIRHASDDFFAVAHYLVIGAAIAALAQTVVDRRLFLNCAALPLLPSFLMMLLAILLNLCSEADAFIAASFRGLLSLPAQMAFMLTGPMFDLKLLLMYRTLFHRRAIIVLAGLILFSVFMVTAILEMIWGRGT